MPVTSDFQYQYGAVDFGDGTAIDVVAHSGFGMPPVRSADMAVARRHGQHPGDDFVDGRFVEITLEVDGTGSSTLDVLVASLTAAFAPGGVEAPLTFQLPGFAGGGKRRVNVRPRRFEQPGTLEQSRGLATVELQLFATDPRVYDDAESSGQVGLPSGGTGLTWPLTWPLNWGAISTSGSVFATNDGNFSAPATIRVDGPVVNPRIENLTAGQTIEADITVNTGDFLLFDTAARTVMLNGTASRYANLTSMSQWWDLAPGSNEIRFRASTATAAAMTVTWRSAWIA